MASGGQRRRPSKGGILWGVIGALVIAAGARWIVGLVVATGEVQHHGPPSGTLTSTRTLSGAER